MPSDIEWPITALFSGKKEDTAPWWRRTTSKTQTQSNGCDGRISIVHFQKWCAPLHPRLPHPKKRAIYIYLYCGFLKRAVMTPIPNDVSVSGNTVGEERGQQLKKKARMIQSLRIPYFRCKMDIRVETWQSAAALTGSGIDNDQWLGQWDVSVQAGKLIKWH